MSSLSLAVMVRDEATRLKRCLESAHGAFDEIVVLDTGSKDESVEVAKSCGARVSETAWPGSFSTAFNMLLDDIKTDWVLRLDSDEWFGANPEEELRGAIEDKGNYGYKLRMKDMLPEGGFREFSIFRMWRCHPLMRYQGAIHENIPNEAIMTAFPSMRLGELSTWVWHDGYLKNGDAKRVRNLHLLEKELAERPDQPYYQAMQALMYRENEDPRGSTLVCDLIDRSVCDAEPSTRMLASVFIAYLSDLSEAEACSERADKTIDRAWSWFANYPGVVWAIGIAELKRKNLDGALRAYLRLEQMAQSGNFERSIPFNASILGPSLWHGLGFVAQQLGRHDIAERCMRNLMKAG